MGGFEGNPTQPGGNFPTLPPPVVGGSGGGGGSLSVDEALQELEGWVTAGLGWDNSVANALVGGLIDELKVIFADIWNWLKSLANTWLGQLIKTVWEKLKEIYQKIAAIVKEIICYLKGWEALEQYYWNLIFKPILQVLSALRRVLLIFRVFHLKFATELDDWLAGIEARLGKIFLLNLGLLNRLIDYLNYIINPFGLVNEGLYLQSALQSISALYAAIENLPNSTLTATQAQTQAEYSTYFTAKNAQSLIVTTAASGLQQIDADNFASAQQALLTLGYQQ